MSNNKSRQNKIPKVLILTQEAAREICKKHGHRKATQEIVDALPNRASLNPTEVAERVHDQLLHFGQNLVKCVERANQVAGKVEKFPERSQQGAALREIREALDTLRDAVERNWDLAGPLLEIETAGQLGRLLTTEATRELLPANLRSRYVNASGNKAEYILQGLKRSFLLEAGLRPATRLIKGAKIVVRRVERRIPSGAPLKVPLEMALLLELADHFEWALLKKASWAARGPFSRFCADVFEKLGLHSEYSWEHILRDGLKHRRSSFGARRQYERRDASKDDGVGSTFPKPRKKQLAPLQGRKTK